MAAMRAYKIEIRPNANQRNDLMRAAGAARWAYNWGLKRKQDEYKLTGKSPSAFTLHKELVKLKKQPLESGGVPWMYESSSCVPNEALRNLDKAFKSFFRNVKSGRKPGFPRFKSRHRGVGGFTLYGSIKSTQHWVQLPRIGKVRIMPGERGYLPQGKHGVVTVSERAGRWFASFLLKSTSTAVQSNGGPVVGLDMGCRVLATLSDGTEFIGAKATAMVARKLKKAQRAVARKKRGSANRKKAVKRIQRIHLRAANLRRDTMHKATTTITKSYSHIVIEDLRVKNMTKKGGRRKRGLNRVMLDASLGEFRRQLEYKAEWYGCAVETVNPAYTSQDCSKCGARNDPGSSKTYECGSCGMVMDRDHNAAINIRSKSGLV